MPSRAHSLVHRACASAPTPRPHRHNHAVCDPRPPYMLRYAHAQEARVRLFAFARLPCATACRCGYCTRACALPSAHGVCQVALIHL
eukprot:816552-Pleurochrysis_carterae.AAC.1